MEVLSESLYPFISAWDALTVNAKADVLLNLRENGVEYVNYLSALLWVLHKTMKAILSIMSTHPNQFFNPLAVCFEAQLMGGVDKNFEMLEELQEKYLSRHQERGTIVGAIMQLLQKPDDHPVYKTETARQKVKSATTQFFPCSIDVASLRTFMLIVLFWYIQP